MRSARGMACLPHAHVRLSSHIAVGAPSQAPHTRRLRSWPIPPRTSRVPRLPWPPLVQAQTPLCSHACTHTLTHALTRAHTHKHLRAPVHTLTPCPLHTFLLLRLSIPSGFLVVFEKPNRSSFTFSFTCTGPCPRQHVASRVQEARLHPARLHLTTQGAAPYDLTTSSSSSITTAARCTTSCRPCATRRRADARHGPIGGVPC